MLKHLLVSSPFHAALWVVIGALQSLTLLAIHRGKVLTNYPRFSTYAHFCVLQAATLMLIPPGDNFMLYAWASYSMGIVQGLLIAAAVAEIYEKTLGPRMALPEWVPQEVAMVLSFAAGSSAALAVIFYPRYGTPALHVFMAIQVALTWAAMLALLGLIFYTGIIAIPWWPRDAQIAGGFVLMLSVNSVTLLLVMTAARPTGRLAARIGQMLVILANAWWCWKLWEKEPAPVRATAEAIAAVLKRNRDTVAEFEASSL